MRPLFVRSPPRQPFQTVEDTERKNPHEHPGWPEIAKCNGRRRQEDERKPPDPLGGLFSRAPRRLNFVRRPLGHAVTFLPKAELHRRSATNPSLGARSSAPARCARNG